MESDSFEAPARKRSLVTLSHLHLFYFNNIGSLFSEITNAAKISKYAKKSNLNSSITLNNEHLPNIFCACPLYNPVTIDTVSIYK